ncbi:MAG TPA: anthranilate phosphoribosyltransferase [Terriglobia bacterium]|nr:anthranilate phosphoribosyltransferase [Terriglobia bacterium]
MRVQQAVEKLNRREHLSCKEAKAVMEELLSGGISDESIAALLIALRDKGETAEELTGFACVMRARASEVLSRAGVDAHQFPADVLLDTCGTGGDGLGTFNISTATALVAAAAGARVAKHGNRSISSRCGSADALEALGVVIELPLSRIPECLEKTGIAFLFAPHLHVAMKHVMNARRSLKTKTVFNLLGPLTNPMGAAMQLAGVYDIDRTALIARVLAAAGTSRAFVVASYDGMDEVSLSKATRVSETDHGVSRTYDLEPGEFGLLRTPRRSLLGGNAQVNARIIRRIMEGEPGPQRDIVLANTSAALVVAGVAANWLEGVEIARHAIGSGAALKTLSALIDFTHKHRL